MSEVASVLGVSAALARLRPVCDQVWREALAGESCAPCHAADVIGPVARRMAVASTKNPRRPEAVAPPIPRPGKPEDATPMADVLPSDPAPWIIGQGTGADGGHGRLRAKA
ncbi:hypothetical protein [Siccirubricoccus sp. G192]|uniref:hypothetical protein n=1 Tax=Siccirubricoccus sp. G192 TaxID=2849651 RepID=UPI001C2B8932|nr:hypothetical protein [Siccirubricoccus sp. G192]MBV1799157.1 hypothetical protein [Siccirubricoccus sp. G192]